LAQKEVIRKIKEGADIVIVCPSAPIGWGDYKPTPTGLLILKFLNREIPFYSDVGFSFVNVKDVARGHVLALEKGKKGEIYILGGHNIFLSEFFDILSRITGLRKPLKLPRHLSSFLGQIVGFILELWAKISGNPPLITRAQARASLLNLFYSSEKAIRELGYTISPIEDAVKDAIRYFLEKGMVKRKIKEKIEGKI
jgi:dihydroflavonol-4-reductase